MKIEKILHLTQLFDIYGNLLTLKQQQIFKCYYFDDISLSEIGDINNISKQAVKDTLNKVEKLLIKYEDKLNFFEKLSLQDKIIKDENIKKEINKIWEK